MKINLSKLLKQLAEHTGAEPPSCEEVSEKSGVDRTVILKLCSDPTTSIETKDLSRIVQYLYREFRPFVDSTTGDTQLLNQIRFELVEFQVDSLFLAGADQVKIK